MKQWEDKALRHWGDLMDMIAGENLAQIEKWGYKKCSPFEWLAYLMEEVGELSEAICDMEYGRNKNATSIPEEALQVATLAIKIMEMSMYPSPDCTSLFDCTCPECVAVSEKNIEGIAREQDGPCKAHKPGFVDGVRRCLKCNEKMPMVHRGQEPQGKGG